MPVITLTAADIAKSKQLEARWYKTQIVKISPLTKSSGGDSYNIAIDFLIEDAPVGVEGKEITRMFNTKAMGMIVPLLVAAGLPADPGTVDVDALLNKKVDSSVIVEIYEGRPVNKINDWLPYGTSGNAPTF